VDDTVCETVGERRLAGKMMERRQISIHLGPREAYQALDWIELERLTLLTTSISACVFARRELANVKLKLMKTNAY